MVRAGERGDREEKMRRKSGMHLVPRASGILELWKMCSRHLFILLQRAQFPGSVGVKHTPFGADLSPLISLA